jgi:HSP20 family molecular chaperone IbpA
MIRFDEKMNQAIAKHNQIDEADDAEMRLETMRINDFQETKDGYLLRRVIQNPKHTKVEVKINNGLLVITTTTLEKDVIEEDLNISKISVMSAFNVSLIIPPNADETRMRKSYRDGVLEVTFPKK